MGPTGPWDWVRGQLGRHKHPNLMGPTGPWDWVRGQLGRHKHPNLMGPTGPWEWMRGDNVPKRPLKVLLQTTTIYLFRFRVVSTECYHKDLQNQL